MFINRVSDRICNWMDNKITMLKEGDILNIIVYL